MTPAFAALALLTCTTLAGGNALAAQSLPTVPELRRALAPLQPEGVRVESLTIDGNRSTALGRSPSNAVLSEFMRKIDQSDNFDRVELAEIRSENDGIHFNLSMDITCSEDAGACLVTEPAAAAAVPRATRGSVHKCQVNGVVRFQDRPCAAGTEAP